MAFTYDVTTDRGKVRLKIGDTDSENPIFTDAEIDAFIAEGTDTNTAAGLALMAIASSRSLLAIAKKAGNYSEDLKAIAGELREQAKMFFSRADKDDIYDDFQEIDWDGVGGFSQVERETNEALREE